MTTCCFLLSVGSIISLWCALLWRRKSRRLEAQIDKYADLWAKSQIIVSEYRHCLSYGYYNLQVKIFHNDIDPHILVAGVDTVNESKWFTIKRYSFNPNDKEDYDFKLREAHELIDIIMEKV